MNKLFIIVFFLVLSIGCFSQPIKERTNSSFTVADQRFQATLNMFTPRYSDTTSANSSIGIDSCGALIFTYNTMALWVRKCSPKRWEQAGGVVSVGEGLSANGLQANLGGPIGTPALFTVDRTINTMRKGIYWTNGTPITTSGGNIWQFTDKSFAPYQFWSEDTLLSNNIDPPTAAMPLSGIFARRTMYYADGILKQNKIYGHYLNMNYNWKDTMVFMTEGGDYNTGSTIEQRLTPRGTGRQATAMHGTGNNNSIYYATPALLVNTVLRNTSGNYIYVRNHLSGVNSYLIAGTTTGDTIQAMVYYTAGGFVGAGTNIKKSYLFAPAAYSKAPIVDSSFGWFDTSRVTRSFHAGSYLVGWGDSTNTNYTFKVTGTTYHRGLVQNFQGTDVASTAGVMTLSGNGNVYEITGTNTITAINNTNLKNGYVVTLMFTSTAVLTDGTANSGAAIGLELAGNVNFTGSADDTITICLGEIGGVQRWREVCRSVN